MIWLSDDTATTTSLPAAWVVATGAAPATLLERSALRRETARRILARQLNVSEGSLTIRHDAKGRPLLLGSAGPDAHISLATRAGHVAVALANRPIGVDVERIDSEAELPLAALHQREREALLALPHALRPGAFAQIWAAKEAYVKALGLGFLRAPESFFVAVTADRHISIQDPLQPKPASGAGLIIKNGGQEILAAAVVTLG